jgi:hypothetical protein
MGASFHIAAFATRELSLEHRPGGTIPAEPCLERGPSPELPTERLDYWAGQRPPQTFLAERDADGGFRLRGEGPMYLRLNQRAQGRHHHPSHAGTHPITGSPSYREDESEIVAAAEGVLPAQPIARDHRERSGTC